jgi:hypothetical protein
VPIAEEDVLVVDVEEEEELVVAPPAPPVAVLEVPGFCGEEEQAARARSAARGARRGVIGAEIRRLERVVKPLRARFAPR